MEAQTGNSDKNNQSNQQDDVGRYLHEKLMTLSMGKDQQKVNKLNIITKTNFS